MSDDGSLRSLVDFAVDIARGAGEITLRHFRGSFEIDRKADGSPVTIADREAESLLARAYRERVFPTTRSSARKPASAPDRRADAGSSIRSTAPTPSCAACRSTA